MNAGPALSSHGEEQETIEGGDQFLNPNGSAIDEGHPDLIPHLQGHGTHHVITIAGVVIISIGNSCSISLVVVESELVDSFNWCCKDPCDRDH